jgi:DNA-directed RNA polymerase alpha subunit
LVDRAFSESWITTPANSHKATPDRPATIPKPMTHPNLAQTSIDTLQLSMKAIAALKRMQVNTIADLMEYTQEDLQILDRESALEIIQALKQHFGLMLPLT